MELRPYYLIKEEDFVSEIEPYIAMHYKGPGRPVEISPYQFFCAVLTGVSWRSYS